MTYNVFGGTLNLTLSTSHFEYVLAVADVIVICVSNISASLLWWSASELQLQQILWL